MGHLPEPRAVGFHSNRLDHRIGTPPLGTVPDHRAKIVAVLSQVDDLGAVGLGPGQPFGDEVDADDGLDPTVAGDAAGHVPDGPEPEDGHAAALGYSGVLDALPGGR